MLTVNIVLGNADLNWIGGRLARELVDRLPHYGVKAYINGPPAALTYYQIVYGPPDVRPAVGLFTHGDHRPRHFARSYDGCIVLNNTMLGYLPTNTESAVIRLPVDTTSFRLSRPLRFGVAGRTYSDGRKGEHLVAHMVEAGYQVRGWGSGWPCPIIGNDLAQLPEFYRSLDYYVDTSYDEGGCIPALEAMACGVPVISHTVGLDGRPVIAYERGSWDSLAKVLYSLTHPRSYNDWAEQHAAFFKYIASKL